MSQSLSFPDGFLGLSKWCIFYGACTQDTDNIITVIVAAVIVVLLIEELRDWY